MQQYNKIGPAGYKKSGHQNGIRFQWTSPQGTKKGSLATPFLLQVPSLFPEMALRFFVCFFLVPSAEFICIYVPA